MIYLLVSFTHKNTDIYTRQKLSFANEDKIDTFLNNLTKNENILEAVLLSTCNRIEIITAVHDKQDAIYSILKELSAHSGFIEEELSLRADIFDSNSAVHHLFSVASSLDSLVIGETQIVGQLKDAFKYSINKGYCAQNLARVFHYAFKTAAKVRTATSLGTGSVSVASTAALKAKKCFENKDVTGVKALVIGAGQMGELAIKHLQNHNFDIVLTSRSYEHALELAKKFDKITIEVRDFKDLPDLINSTQVLMSATSSQVPIITKNMLRDFPKKRFWFDIAVPKDIENNLSYDNLQIFNVDDLQDIVDENMALRAQNAKIAFVIVSTMAKEFFIWLKSLGVEPVIKYLHELGENTIEEKIKKAIKKGFIDKKDEANITKLCQNIMSDFLHKPSKHLRIVSKTMEGDVALGSIQNMFGLKEDLSMINKYKCEHSLENSIS